MYTPPNISQSLISHPRVIFLRLASSISWRARTIDMATPGGSDGAPKGEYLQTSSSSASSMSGSSFTSGDSSSTTTEPTSLTFRKLEEITDNFSKERVLGQGAYGKVYKGILENGEEIAVKILHYNTQAVDDNNFKHEFDNLMMLDHKNIIRFVGYCYERRFQHTQFEGKRVFGETTYKALCFEYMQMGSLESYLSDETKGLDWQARYKIIKGTCEGLNYLHEELEEPIYHLDLKPDNILLDKNMVPKLADFGLSKLFPKEQTRVTQTFNGTLGYMPPEYLRGQIVSKKFDIFSLGVVITKIISGPRGHTRSAEGSLQEFLDQVNANWRNRLEAKCTPETLETNCEQVSICTEIGLRCMDEDRHERPSIVDIIHMLDVTETMIKKGTTLRRLLSNTTLDDNRSAKVLASGFSEALARLFRRPTVDNAFKSTDSGEDYKLLKAKESPWRVGDIPDTLLKSIVTMYDHETEKCDPKIRDKERQYMVEKVRKEIRGREEAEQAQLRSDETVEELLMKPEETTKEKQKQNAEADVEVTCQIQKQVKEELEFTRPMPAKEQNHKEKLLAEKQEQRICIVQYMMEGDWK